VLLQYGESLTSLANSRTAGGNNMEGKQENAPARVSECVVGTAGPDVNKGM